MERNCWLVMQYQADSTGAYVYTVQGIFNDPILAAAECLTDQYCVIPMTMNETIPHEFHENEETFFPMAAR